METIYLRRIDLKRPKSIVTEIHSLTNVWVFAIYPVGLSIAKGDVNQQTSVLAAKIDIFNLIEKEILSAVFQKLQDFIIKISRLDNISAELLTKLVGNDLSLTSEMTQISTLIRYDSFSNSYRMHHLFRSFIMKKKHWIDEKECTKRRKMV